MNERNLTVIGSYSTREEALSVIEQLRDEGYDRDESLSIRQKMLLKILVFLVYQELM